MYISRMYGTHIAAPNLINHLRISTFDCVVAGEFADGLTLILISSPVPAVPARRMGEEGRAPLFVCLPAICVRAARERVIFLY